MGWRGKGRRRRRERREAGQPWPAAAVGAAPAGGGWPAAQDRERGKTRLDTMLEIDSLSIRANPRRVAI
jgi:hypothetical protein